MKTSVFVKFGMRLKISSFLQNGPFRLTCCQKLKLLDDLFIVSHLRIYEDFGSL